MTGPVVGRFTLKCSSCQALIYSSDDQPPSDSRAELERFADEQCPRGGTAGGCPNTSNAVAEAAERRPARLLARLREARQQIQEWRAEVVELATDVRALEARQPRTVVFPIPALAAGRHDLFVSWPSELPNIPRVQVTPELPRSGAAVVRMVVLAGSRSVIGCTIVVDTTVAIPEGQGWLHVTATP